MYNKKISAVSALNEYIHFVKIMQIAPAIQRGGNNKVFGYNSIVQLKAVNKNICTAKK
jgi:hypothetical protein